jgi:cation diffusion facilitator CzcD-associated flavoprotein CzcO
MADLSAKIASTLAKRHLKTQIPNAQLREKLSPQYNFGCKRVLISDDFYPSLNYANVNLVVDKIVRIDESGITIEGNQHFKHDIIVCATGFKLDHLARAVNVQGLKGTNLQLAFKDGPQAYLGTVVRDMPNLFMLLGPNTATGDTSTLLYIEAQVKLSLRLMQEVLKTGKSQLVVKPSVFEQYDRQLQARFAKTSWSGSCLSWYKTASGRNIAIWPGSTRQFWKALEAATLDDFEVA